MSADSSSAAVAPNLNLSPEEKRLYGQLFRQADTEGVGVVTGEVAVSFFEKTRLDSRVLGEIWQIADKENRGFLTPAGFGTVLRLIGHAQSGREPTADIALQRAPLPRFDGIAVAPFSSPAAAQPPSSPTGPVRIPPLTQDKVAQYAGLYDRQPLQGNMLPGEQARQIFDKSGLPNETLGRIWALSDTEQRGALSKTEFVIAMHLLTSTKAGALRGLPNILPAGLYEAAAGRPGVTSQSPRGSVIPAIPRQMSGVAANRTGSPLGRSAGGSDWAVSSADKAKFDQLYVDLDKANKGYITGDEAVPFFSKSGLPEDSLALIWDLADINSSGQLTRDEFAVAMFLIRQQRLGNSGPLPATLPASLIPPSMRSLPRQPAASAFEPPPISQPPPPQPKSALDDLFGLDSGTSSPAPAPAPASAAPMQTTMSTGGSGADPFAGGTPTSPVRAATTGTTFKPFIPSSTFGRGLAGQPHEAPAASDDLLADNDPEGSKKINAESTELANLSNQIGTLSKEMQDVQAKRTTTQTELNQSTSQKQNFEQRLAQLRQLYEKEAKETQTLEEELRKARSETQKLQGECLSLEGNYRDIQQQHQQLSTALQTDQQENGNLRERIRVANAAIAQLKPQIEKLKMEARQQKGLVAINKKQLATTEGERDKLKTEAESLAKNAAEDQTRQAQSTSPELSLNQIASPALSTSSGNNPFFNRTQSSDIMGVFAAPKNASDKSFDEVFGPSGSLGTQSPAPAAAPVKPQLTGASTASTGSYNTPGSTPAVSRQATLRADNPPPPPASRQISSSFLPFSGQPASVSSSRQVSPPASRAGDSFVDATDAPKNIPQISDETAIRVGTTEQPESSSATPVAVASGANDSVTSIDEAVSPLQKNELAKAKEDFDNAFAAFATSKSNQGSAPAAAKSKSTVHSEFPPISELEHDDESDTDSEHGGFDDDFEPTSPGRVDSVQVNKDNTEAVSVKTATTPPAPPPKEPRTASPASNSEELPSSPVTVKDNTIRAPQDETAEDIFGAAGTASTHTSKGAFDDLDDDFEGLEDAKEGSADDDFANISRSGLDDFNPVFDSSPPASQTKSDATTFGNESSFDFVTANPAGSNSQQKGTESHDWDAIFAGLDSTDDAIAPASAEGDHPKVAKPEPRPLGPGRALTEQGVHDDPILKNLTGMGYARSDAVAALEKYDYNLERAANFLASQS